MFSYPQPASVQCAFPVIRETLPRSKLGYATNNMYPEFPPIMEDGRALIASYQPEAVLNNNLLKQSGVKTNWEYRKYLTENSVQISRQNFREACNDTGYLERFSPNEIDSTSAMNQVPYIYTSYSDNSKPNGYSESDLKEVYLSREQLNARRFAPAITQDQLLIMLQRPSL